MTLPKVLLVLDHAPDYRETFLRELSQSARLTVVAQPCEPDRLTAPADRWGYEYVEIAATQVGGVYWQPGLTSLANRPNWDVICMGLNLRHPARVLAFLLLPTRWHNWVWRGHIFGRSDSWLLNRIRCFLLRRATACLVYSQVQVQEVARCCGVSARSFNNTEVKRSEFRQGIHTRISGRINLLFVGRNQPRKKLDRLIKLAERREDVFLRLVGPDMDMLDVPRWLEDSRRVVRFGKTSGDALNRHFDWAHLVANPGHAGLLVMNAARHQKAIVVDSESRHAPEYWLAAEADQPFIDFGDLEAVNHFLDSICGDPALPEGWGKKLQNVAKEKYTIENMVKAHMSVFSAIARSN